MRYETTHFHFPFLSGRAWLGYCPLFFWVGCMNCLQALSGPLNISSHPCILIMMIHGDQMLEKEYFFGFWWKEKIVLVYLKTAWEEGPLDLWSHKKYFPRTLGMHTENIEISHKQKFYEIVFVKSSILGAPVCWQFLENYCDDRLLCYKYFHRLSNCSQNIQHFESKSSGDVQQYLNIFVTVFCQEGSDVDISENLHLLIPDKVTKLQLFTINNKTI